MAVLDFDSVEAIFSVHQINYYSFTTTIKIITAEDVNPFHYLPRLPIYSSILAPGIYRNPLLLPLLIIFCDVFTCLS